VRIRVELADRTVLVRPWRAQVGRITLVLLDTNIPENPSDLQDVTDELYGVWYEPLVGAGPNTGYFATTARTRQLGLQLRVSY
jgi:hypothetical protein